jgi:hypothetical protein
MTNQAGKGSSHQLNKINLTLNKTNEKLDKLIDLLTKFIRKENEKK